MYIMQCTPQQIEAKRQLALQKLAEKNKVSSNQQRITGPSVSPFKFKDTSKFYQKPYEKPKETTKFSGSEKPITGTCVLISEDRFVVEMSGFNEAVVDVFKTILSKNYNSRTRMWDFHVNDHNILLTKLQELKPTINIERLPNFVLNCVTKKSNLPLVDIDFSKIEPELFNSLMLFQIEGVRFGIERNGRCLIGDDMGLGKTFQALAIAHYYYEDWPLLIVTTSSMKNVWEETIYRYLPSVSAFQISYMTSSRDYIDEVNVLIVSHDLMARCIDKLKTKRFGVMIIDESHTIKNFKAKCTKAAMDLGKIAKRVILLSGTPALSRPMELYSQLALIDEKFFGSFFTYAKRYCDGKNSTFGFDATGKSNLQELEIILSKKFMIRRTKEDVLKSLPNKVQEIIKLDVKLNEFSEKDRMCLNALAARYNSEKSAREKHSALLTFFQETARIKIPSVCSYILQTLQSSKKFIIFAHHQVMLKAIAKIMDKKDVKYIRIDGNTHSEQRKYFVDKFQNDDSCIVALLSITAANAGITLTKAKLVIFAELHWNPSILSQAESRAHRIGQSDCVVIQYLIASGTADDSIWTLIQNKQKILEEIGLSKDSFKDVNVKKQTTSRHEPLTDDLNMTLTQANTKDISTYFNKSPSKISDNVVSENISGVFDDGFDDILSSIDV